jgi:hypothetical protein
MSDGGVDATSMSRPFAPRSSMGAGREEGPASLGSGDGAQGRNRTTDTVIFSHVLYQLSYLGFSAVADVRL